VTTVPFLINRLLMIESPDKTMPQSTIAANPDGTLGPINNSLS
jgi:hypothetical protein